MLALIHNFADVLLHDWWESNLCLAGNNEIKWYIPIPSSDVIEVRVSFKKQFFKVIKQCLRLRLLTLCNWEKKLLI